MNPFDAVGTARISAAVYDRDVPAARRTTSRRGRRSGDRGERGRCGAADDLDPAGSPRSSSSCAAPAAIPTCGSARRCGAPSTWCSWPRSLGGLRRPAGRRPLGRPRCRAGRAVGRVRIREGSGRASEDDHPRAVATRCSPPTAGGGDGKRLTPRRGHDLPGLVRQGGRRGRRGGRRRRRSARPRGVSWRATSASRRSRPRSASSTSRRSTTLLGETTPTRRWRCWPTSPGPPTRSCASWPGAWPPGSLLDLARRGPPRRARRRQAARAAATGPTAATSTSTPASRPWPWPEPRARRPIPTTLRVRALVRPGTALCLLVDRSGSMGGEPLATAAVAAAAVAWRAPDDYSVLAFGKDVVVAKGAGRLRQPSRSCSDVLALRGLRHHRRRRRAADRGGAAARSRAGRR